MNAFEYLATSSSSINAHERHRKATSSSRMNAWKALMTFYCKNTFLLYVVVEIGQLLKEISSFPEVLYKRGDQRNFSKFTDKHKKQSSGGVFI